MIPNQLKKAQAQLVLEQLNGVTILPTQAGIGVASIANGPDGAITPADGRLKIMSKLDVLADQWSETQGTNIAPFMPAVDAYLRQLFEDNGAFFEGVRI